MEQQKKASGLREVTQELVGWEDNKLVRTLNHLTTRPGAMIQEYCQGEKQKYLSPVVYFFGVTAVETYLASVSGLFDFMLKQNADSMRKSFSDPAFASANVDTSTIPDQFNSFYSFLLSETGQKIIFLPILLMLTWFFYRRYNASFRETSWFALYTLSHLTLLTLPLILYWYVTEDLTSYTIAGLALASVYWIWVSKQFFRLTLGKAVLLRVLFLVSVLVIMSMIGPLLIVFYAIWS